jgi:DNA polymerase bacteriophage-type
VSEIFCDFETRSDVDIKVNGLDRYFASEHFQPLILCYSIDGGPIQEWTLFDSGIPEALFAAIDAGATIHAHNAAFERKCFEWLSANASWPAPQHYRCSMATACALGLPRKLENLAAVLSLKAQKDKYGATLIRKFSIPRKTDDDKVLWNEPLDNQQEFAEFVNYCRQDVATEMEAERRMVALSADEQAVWELSERINQRGIRIDLNSAHAALRLIEKATAQLDAEMARITNGAITACSQVARLTRWTEAQGVSLDGVAKDDILEALEDDLPDAVRNALLIRQEAGKASTSKLKAFINRAGPDGRLRHAFVYHGAAPGRWSSVGVNIANLPRPRKEYDDAQIDPRLLFDAFRTEEPDLVRAMFGTQLGRPLHLVSDALRGFLWADRGHDFIAVDYSGIQGAITAWLSNEQPKLTAMREIIADPSKPDLYRRAAARILNTTTDVVTKKHWARQIGKVAELALGFSGGVSALVSMAKNYGMRHDDLHALYQPVWASATPEAREKAAKRYDRALNARNKSHADTLSREAWIACSLIVSGWRVANPMIVQAWGILEDAVRLAVREPGSAVLLNRIKYLVRNGFLWCMLPSGRCIAYASPRLKDQVWARFLVNGAWSEAEVADRDEAERLERQGRSKIEGATSQKVTALGVDAQTQKMTRYALYGGLLMENLAMGIERDCLVKGIRNCEAAGYPIVMTNYDEAVAEMPHGSGSVEEMCGLMLELDPWTAGLPLTATGFRSKRYKK